MMDRASNDERALERALDAIGPLDTTAMEAASAHIDGLAKPPGSLGRLEGLLIELAGITGRPDPPVARRTIVVAAADHGVVRQGVSAYPSEVTVQMVANFMAGGAAINILADWADARLVVVDAGVGSVVPDGPIDPIRGGRLVRARIRDGTGDMTAGPAMTRAEALRAIAVGLDLVTDLRTDGLDLIGVGDMGIGNTTAASALTAVLTGSRVGLVTGRGTGIDVATHQRKIDAIERALLENGPDPADPIGVLAAIGGLEIAVLVGVIVGAAAAGVPVVLDGFITGAAALVAWGLRPAVAPRLIAAHRSVEPGHAVILSQLDRRPVLDLGLRLGEGTGAALAMGLIAAAVAVRDEMATFGSASISGPVEPSRDPV